VEVSLVPALGAIGTFAAWISVVVLHGEARSLGIPWMVAGLAGYAIYRRRAGLSLTEPARIERGTPPADFVPLEYHSALVPIFGTDVSARALRSAAKLVGPGAMVDAIYVIRVPAQLPLDAPLDGEEAIARRVLEGAELVGRRNGLRVRTTLMRTRNPGRTIAEEAARLGAEVIYLGTCHAPPSERALGPTARELLERRPCRIVIES
jgi:APA family basic amino acid/polyamine antiporter